MMIVDSTSPATWKWTDAFQTLLSWLWYSLLGTLGTYFLTGSRIAFMHFIQHPHGNLWVLQLEEQFDMLNSLQPRPKTWPIFQSISRRVSFFDIVYAAYQRAPFAVDTNRGYELSGQPPWLQVIHSTPLPSCIWRQRYLSLLHMADHLLCLWIFMQQLLHAALWLHTAKQILAL